MRLRDIMSAGVVTIGPDEPVSEATAKMRDHNIRHLVVVENGQLAGIISERDTGSRRATARHNPPVRELMSTDVVSVTPATTLRQAANLMRGRTIGCLPVIADDHVVGLITTTDLLDRLGSGGTRPNIRIERPPVRRPPGSGVTRGPTGPRGGRRASKPRVEEAPAKAATPRAARQGRASQLPPAHVRVIGATISEDDKGEIKRKLGSRLGKFSSSIERASVRLSDVNGPRGGVDHKCLIKVVLAGLPSVVVERVDSQLQRAINSAIDATAMAVRRNVQRRRLKPLRGRKTSARNQAA